MTTMHTNKLINRPKTIFNKKTNIVNLIPTSAGGEREKHGYGGFTVLAGDFAQN